MPYFFHCENCNSETNVGYPPDEVHNACDGCGVCLCPACSNQIDTYFFCDDCARDESEDEARDKLEKENE